MIKRINRIKNYRIFQNWQPDIGIADFSKVNLLYGVNGSGKSTLCSLMAEAIEDKEWKSGLSISVKESTNEIREVHTFDDSLWEKLRVFNRRYIQENLKFDLKDQSLANTLLQIGKVNIDRENEINDLKARIAKIESDLPKKQQSLSIIKDKQEKIARDTAELIGSELGPVGGRYRSRSYTATQVRQLVNQTLQGVDVSKISENLEVINSPQFPILVIPDRNSFSTQDLSVRIWEICNRSATSIIIDSLEKNSPHAQWVQQGFELHEGLDKCLFCAGKVSVTRRSELNSHFSLSLKLLQSDIEVARSAVQVLRINLLRIKNLIPDVMQLLPELRAEYENLLKEADVSSSDLLERLAKFDVILEEKKFKLFESIDISPIASPDVNVDFGYLVQLLHRHNALVPQIEESLEPRAQQVEHARILAIQSEFLEDSKEVNSLELEISEFKIDLAAKRNRLGSVENENGDPTSLAEELNVELAEILGRPELVFSFLKDGVYSIERDGVPATYLSEGEKSVISLLYFVKSLDAADCDRSNTIVMIDDPISSMDSNFTIGISARIWASLVGKNGSHDKCKQLFLFTHNFDFFRSWCNHLDRMSSNFRNQQGITYLILEIRIRFKMLPSSKSNREPFFLQWPIDVKLKKRLRSEYHYLFWRVAESLRKCQEEPSLENDLEAAAILPNSCRRLLEGFLSFRFPSEIGDFRAQLSKAIDSVIDPAARTRLLTFLHQYSHNEEGDTGKPVDRPESVRILSSVFELINLVDKAHYEEMVEALELVHLNLLGVS